MAPSGSWQPVSSIARTEVSIDTARELREVTARHHRTSFVVVIRSCEFQRLTLWTASRAVYCKSLRWLSERFQFHAGLVGASWSSLLGVNSFACGGPPAHGRLQRGQTLTYCVGLHVHPGARNGAGQQSACHITSISAPVQARLFASRLENNVHLFDQKSLIAAVVQGYYAPWLMGTVLWCVEYVLSSSRLFSKRVLSMAACYLLLVAFATLGAAQARTLPSSAEHALTVATAADLLAPSPRATTITPDPKYEPLMCAGPLRLLDCADAFLQAC